MPIIFRKKKNVTHAALVLNHGNNAGDEGSENPQGSTVGRQQRKTGETASMNEWEASEAYHHHP